MFHRDRNRSLIGFSLFVLPAFLIYSLFVLLPAVGGIWFSFTDWNLLNPDYSIIGLENYVEAITQDIYFLKSVLFTLKFVAFMVVLQNFIALFLAVLIENRRQGRTVFRTVFFMPNMISMMIAGFMWMFVFTKVIPELSGRLLPAFLDQSWVGDPTWSFYAILVVSLWAGVGYLMVIYIAGLQSVPNQYLEAAAIDGAGGFRIFRSIIIPQIIPSITIGVFLALNSSFKVFEAVFALTGGGPGRATQVIALNIFEEAFNMSNRYGYASAKAMILFLIVFVITLIQLRVMKTRELEA